MGPRNLVVATVLTVALAAGVWSSLYVKTPPPTPTTATVLPVPMPLPAFTLLDQQGRAVDASVFTGSWDLVFFGFTHCPDICPLTLQLLTEVRRRLADAGQEPLPRIVLVSVDPERDTPAALASYMGYYGDDNLGLTGELEELRKLTEALGIFFQQVPGDDGNYTVDHSAVVLLVDPQGRYVALFGAPHRMDGFVHDLPLMMTVADEPAPPLVIDDVVVTRPMPGRSMSAGYFTLTNNGDTAVAITSVQSPQFGSVEMHETLLDDGVARMRALDRIVVEAGTRLRFEPGGKHLMLMQPAGSPQAVTLQFYSADTLLLSVGTTIDDVAN